MAVVQRANVPAPTLPRETVENLAGFDGDVVVQGLLLTERLAVQERVLERKAGGDSEQLDLIPELLAATVVDADGQRIYTREQWQIYGATHEAESLRVFGVAARLCGFNAADAKKN